MRPNPGLRGLSWTALCLCLLAGCARKNGADATTEPTPSGPVNVISPQRRSLTRMVEQPGAIHPYEESTRSAKLPGYVRKVHVDIGQRVKGPEFNAKGQEARPGDLLVELAMPELVADQEQKAALVRQAEAEVEQAEKARASADANVTASDALVAEAEAGVTRAQAIYERWDKEARNVADLVAKGVIDAQTRDETLKQFQAAQAGREEARARVSSARALAQKARTDKDKSVADVKAANARVDVAKAALRRVEADLSYAQIRAPFDGVVTRRNVNTGDLPSSNGAEDKASVTVARLDPVRVVVYVPEADAALVNETTEAALTIQAASPSSRTGTVQRTSWSLDPGARTLRAEVELANKDHTLRPGMYVYARLKGRLPEEWVLPASAVVKQGDAQVVFLVENGKAVRTPVQRGHADGDLVQVLRRQKPGTNEWVPLTGEEKVAERAAGLTDGQVVTGVPTP